jgi:hypothetical protein
MTRLEIRNSWSQVQAKLLRKDARRIDNDLLFADGRAAATPIRLQQTPALTKQHTPGI